MIGRLSAFERGFGERQEENSCFGGGGEQARGSLSHLSHALDRHQNRVLEGKGGPGLAASFAQRNGKPRQAQDVCSCTSLDLWMRGCDRGSGNVQMLYRRTFLVIIVLQ